MVIHSNELLKRAGGKLPEVLTQYEKSVKRHKAMTKPPAIIANGRLTIEQVFEIRWAWARHIRPTQTAMAKYYNVPQPIISRICNNETYPDIKGTPKQKYIQY